jgi:uncharacterized membrane protein YfcA
LVQALAISAFVSSVALALGLGFNHGLGGAIAMPAVAALMAAFAGMAIGKVLRSKLSVRVFRKTVLAGLLALGASMVARLVL